MHLYSHKLNENEIDKDGREMLLNFAKKENSYDNMENGIN